MVADFPAWKRVYASGMPPSAAGEERRNCCLPASGSMFMVSPERTLGTLPEMGEVAVAQEGILVSRRLVLKDSVTPDDIERLAETLHWQL
jgi:hypothetical protein